MNNKIVCSLLLILLILFIIIIIRKYYCHDYNYNDNNKNILTENFASNPWITDKDVLEAEKAPLNEVQKKEVENMVQSLTSSELKTLISTQSPLLVGPAGPPGIQGPPGTPLIASGRLVNKNGSYDNYGGNNPNTNYFNPLYIVSRTEGTSPTSSLSFMEQVSPFASYQSWSLDVNNNIINRYDKSCLTMNETQDKIYMDKCSSNPNQKWTWDSSNRIISTTASTDKKLKCIGLTKPETNVLTTSLPGCKGDSCLSNTPRRYLNVKDCDINNVNEDEIWSFI